MYTSIIMVINSISKYLVTFVRVGRALPISGPKAEGVPSKNQRRYGSGRGRLWGGLDKARHIVPTALLVKSAILQAVKGRFMVHGHKLIID